MIFPFSKGSKDLYGIILSINFFKDCRQQVRFFKGMVPMLKPWHILFLKILWRFPWPQFRSYHHVQKKHIGIFFSHHLIPESFFSSTVRNAVVLMHFFPELVQQDLTTKMFVVPEIVILSVRDSKLLLMMQRVNRKKSSVSNQEFSNDKDNFFQKK